jgi:hypothetical protein
MNIINANTKTLLGASTELGVHENTERTKYTFMVYVKDHQNITVYVNDFSYLIPLFVLVTSGCF